MITLKSPKHLLQNRRVKVLLIFLILIMFFGAEAYAAVSGKKLWSRRYSSPTKIFWASEWQTTAAFDELVAITLGRGNTIYVTGSSMRVNSGLEFRGCWTTIKYNSSGKQMWKRHYRARGDVSSYAEDIATDRWGNVYVTGISGAFNGSEEDIIVEERVDLEDEILIAGSGYDLNGDGFDQVTVKYGPNGRKKWAKRFKVEVGYTPSHLKVSKRGNIYIALTGSLGDGQGQIIIKYDRKGRRKWVRRFQAKSEPFAGVVDMAIDKHENVYVVSDSSTDTNWADFDFVTTKYGPKGKRLWTRRYEGLNQSFNWARDVAVDKYSNVYTTGQTGEGVVTIKYDKNGKRMWIKKYYDEFKELYFPSVFGLDQRGNIYVSGTSDKKWITIKYNSAGTRLWGRSHKGAGYPWKIGIRSGSIYVVGKHIVKYDKTGKKMWANRAKLNGFDDLAGVVVGKKDALYVGGTPASYNYETGYDFITIKYAP